jgi:NAD(P)-dependent dehydrogenase (short-subunit alcohol dehydrogenase family)
VSDRYELTGRHAVVTGGGSGIGLATAGLFLESGATVTVLAVDDAMSEGLAGLSSAHEGRVRSTHCDVADEQAFSAALADAHAAVGRLDFLVNNAGISQKLTPIVDTTLEEFDRMIAVDLRAVFIGIKYAAPLIEQQGGAIVNVASTMGLVAQPGVGAYIAAKHGVVGLTKTAAVELGTRGVRVNAIAPGRHATPMIAWQRPESQSVDPAYEEEVRRKHPATQRVGRPEEAAAAIVFLCSDGASNIHGVVLPVDGGWTAQ